MKGEFNLAFLITLVFGVAVLVAVASMSPTMIGAVANATESLGSLGTGGTIGALLLGLLFGLVLAIGIIKVAADIFNVKIGI